MPQDGETRDPDPTPEEIAERCAEIQSAWSEHEFYRRIRGIQDGRKRKSLEGTVNTRAKDRNQIAAENEVRRTHKLPPRLRELLERTR